MRRARTRPRHALTRALAPETANTSDAPMYETKFGVELGCLSSDGQMIARRLLGSGHRRCNPPASPF